MAVPGIAWSRFYCGECNGPVLCLSLDFPVGSYTIEPCGHIASLVMRAAGHER